MLLDLLSGQPSKPMALQIKTAFLPGFADFLPGFCATLHPYLALASFAQVGESRFLCAIVLYPVTLPFWVVCRLYQSD